MAFEITKGAKQTPSKGKKLTQTYKYVTTALLLNQTFALLIKHFILE